MSTFNKKLISNAEYVRLISLFNAGQYEELEKRALSLLKKNPGAGVVWNVLGVALGVQGKNALNALQKAAHLLPDDPSVHCNLGNQLRIHGRLKDAAASLAKALALFPDYAEALINYGIVLRELGQSDLAIEYYSRALKLQPNNADAHCHLGNAQFDLACYDLAEGCYRRALAIKPDLAEAHCGLGNSLRKTGHLTSAVESFQRALAIKPELADAHSSLGATLWETGNLNGAVESCQRSLAINPKFAEAHYNLGNALRDLGRLDDAIASFQSALAIKPELAVAHHNLLLSLNYQADQCPAQMVAAAKRFNDSVAQKVSPFTVWHNDPDPDRCVRVGLVSGDFRTHPVGFFLEGVLAALAAKCSRQFEYSAYLSSSNNDELTKRLLASCHQWHLVSELSDLHLAEKIRDDEIDILIDLSGHTAYNRLPMFVLKPAPVQATWLGYFATTGLAAIDYLIADPWSLPVSEECYFTEKICRLPETRLCFTPPKENVELTQLPALASNQITFGCFNNPTKINDAVVALWARVLLEIPNSRLLLKAGHFSEKTIRESFLKRFSARGVAAERIYFEGAEPRAGYFSAYGRVDVALDPFPFSGATTTAEGLWMGVPTLTLSGERLVSRQGVGLLMNAGLSEWIASDADDYVSRAKSHTSDLLKLATLRAELRRQILRSPICDAPRFANHFEAALRNIWREWCAQKNNL